mmetsp:Transcript_55285/g.156742  ORF Transcript_55285/g.156742 Transcript_55285/m.156742 type:complete len:264 (+) Transcript_55285:597-1388(+)
MDCRRSALSWTTSSPRVQTSLRSCLSKARNSRTSVRQGSDGAESARSSVSAVSSKLMSNKLGSSLESQTSLRFVLWPNSASCICSQCCRPECLSGVANSFSNLCSERPHPLSQPKPSFSDCPLAGSSGATPSPPLPPRDRQSSSSGPGSQPPAPLHSSRRSWAMSCANLRNCSRKAVSSCNIPSFMYCWRCWTEFARSCLSKAISSASLKDCSRDAASISADSTRERSHKKISCRTSVATESPKPSVCARPSGDQLAKPRSGE